MSSDTKVIPLVTNALINVTAPLPLLLKMLVPPAVILVRLKPSPVYNVIFAPALKIVQRPERTINPQLVPVAPTIPLQLLTPKRSVTPPAINVLINVNHLMLPVPVIPPDLPEQASHYLLRPVLLVIRILPAPPVINLPLAQPLPG